jgi:Cys-tRNA(Pro)/Cys-tRNA(Cys) deacylase
MAKAPDSKGGKTNAMRVLEAHRVDYTAHHYEPIFHSATEVAELLNVPSAQVFKTLVVLPESGKGRPLLVVMPGDRELDLNLLGQQPAVGEKRLRMASQREAESLTGLLVGGISPLALLQKGFRIFIDQSALTLDRIYVSGGQRGVNLQVATADLIRVIGALPVPTHREGG